MYRLSLTLMGPSSDPPGDSLLPRTGAWIMPNNKDMRNFGTFPQSSWCPQPDALFDHVNSSVDSIPAIRFSLNDKPKAVIHTWLAWQKEPGKPYGTAITARFLDPGFAPGRCSGFLAGTAILPSRRDAMTSPQRSKRLIEVAFPSRGSFCPLPAGERTSGRGISPRCTSGGRGVLWLPAEPLSTRRWWMTLAPMWSGRHCSGKSPT